ncbi:MAG: arylamine N-acetyltransferase [Sandaracinus sp.]
MSFQPDLEAYFMRIGYRGPRAPTLAVLDALALAHVTAIPFENLDVLLGRGIELALDRVEHKLVHARRGGYCFEQNTYFLAVLAALGFEVRPVSARVRLNRPPGVVPPRTHVAVHVVIDGVPRLADVGVGALSPTASLRLDVAHEQPTPHEPRRFVREGRWEGTLRDPSAKLVHQARLGESWVDVAELTLEEMPEIDREVGNWFTSTSPASRFRRQLMVARATEDGRVTIADDVLTRRGRDGVAHETKLAGEAALRAALREHFGLVLDERVPLPMPPYA